MVERQLPKLYVEGSIPFSRSKATSWIINVLDQQSPGSPLRGPDNGSRKIPHPQKSGAPLRLCVDWHSGAAAARRRGRAVGRQWIGCVYGFGIGGAGLVFLIPDYRDRTTIDDLPPPVNAPDRL